MKEEIFQKIPAYLESLSSSGSAPGGGSAAGLAGALACSLILMVLNISRNKIDINENLFNKKKSFLFKLRKEFLDFSRKDAEFYLLLKKKNAKKQLQSLLKESVRIPVKVCKNCKHLVRLIEEISVFIKGGLIADLLGAIKFTETAFKVSYWNIKLNIKEIEDEKFLLNISKLIEKGRRLDIFDDIQELETELEKRMQEKGENIE